MPAGRFAPSPSGDLHVGNLRTALLAWLFARSTGRDFVLRVEDLDRVRPGAEQRQLDDLAALGLDWDGPVVRQTERLAAYDAAVQALADADLVYPCFCTRREVQEAPSAPHLPPGAYPGTCRDLTDAQREARATARPAALRLRAAVTSWTVHDVLHGDVEGVVDDVVLRRNDGTPAYNLAVVVDGDTSRCGDSTAERRDGTVVLTGGDPAATTSVRAVLGLAWSAVDAGHDAPDVRLGG